MINYNIVIKNKTQDKREKSFLFLFLQVEVRKSVTSSFLFKEVDKPHFCYKNIGTSK